MADTTGRYPLSTANGQYIPLDVMRPNSMMSKTFVTGSSTGALTCPASIEILEIFADQDLIITFAASSASAAALSDGTSVADSYILKANTLAAISPPIGKKSFALRAITANGTALINFIESWSGLALASQSTRR